MAATCINILRKSLYPQNVWKALLVKRLMRW